MIRLDSAPPIVYDIATAHERVNTLNTLAVASGDDWEYRVRPISETKAVIDTFDAEGEYVGSF